MGFFDYIAQQIKAADAAQTAAPSATPAPPPAPALDFVGPALPANYTPSTPKSPFQNLYGGSQTAQSVDAFRAGNPALWGNLYSDIQSGQMRLGKYYPAQTGYDEVGNVMGTPAAYDVVDAEGNPTQWKAYEVPNNPNAVQFTLTHGDYIQNMVVGTDPATGYIAPVTDNSKQVEFHRWNYGSSGLTSLLQNPVAPLMLSALLPGLGEAFGGSGSASGLFSGGAEEVAAMQAASQATLPSLESMAVSVPATSDLYSLAPSTPNTGLGIQASQGEGLNLFAPAQGIEGGGMGLQLPQVSNLESMGGAQGLTTMAAGGSGLLGETGIGTTSTTVLNPVTGKPLGQELSNINTGVTDVTGNPVSSSTGNVPNSLVKQLVNTLLGSNMADNTNTAALGSGLLGGLGSSLQGQYAKDAAQMIADKMAAATESAVSGSQFRPVGITTRFGASNYTVNPQTGQLESAGYTPTALSEQLQQGAQNVYNLGQGYVAQSPQQAAAQWMQAQQNLLAPSRDVALSNLRNQVYQRGREGLSMAQGGDLQAANPEMAAYYNSLANQNAQLAAQAQQMGQQQAQFGTGLLGSSLGLMGGINTLEQQPLTLGASLGAQSSAAGARAGQLGLIGTQAGQKYLFDAATYSPVANALIGAGKNPLVSQLTGNLLSQYVPQLGNWISGLSSIPGGGGLPDLSNYNLTADNATNFWSY